MSVKGPTDGVRHAVTAAALALAGLLAPAGCSGLAEDIEAAVPERVASTTPMRLDRPDKLLDG
ncbi:hypothetical protein [Micromonospora musae]|uniref:hypothetical protein n=1 Tax=Micromonospora musae TaxID=1894970 RepID=UPI0033DA6740